MPKEKATTELALTPMSRTASKSSAAPRMAIPITVRLSRASRPMSASAVTPMTRRYDEPDLKPEHGQRVVHPVGLRHCAHSGRDERLEGRGDEDTQTQ